MGETVLAGQWRNLGSAVQDAVDGAFVAGSDGYHFEARGWKYEVDFARMVQINLATKRERALRRTPLSSTPPKSAPKNAAAPLSAVPVIAAAPLPAGPAMAAAPAAAPKLPAKVAALPPSKAAAPPVPPVSSMPAPKKAAPKKPSATSGRVKVFFQEKGYGFIALEDGTEAFFHISSLDEGVSVKKNDTVEVSTSKDRSGKVRAKMVSLVKKAPLMRQICRNPTCCSKGDRHFEDRCPLGGFRSAS